jgi:septum formation protein
MQPRWILASSSPRRIELLRRAGFALEVIPSEVEESKHHDGGMENLCRENARRKACDVASRESGAWVIGADTLVGLDGMSLGKPMDRAEARAMLRALSGRVNHVCTGVCVVSPEGRERIFHETTEVEFLQLSDAVIDDYMARVETLDKAGGYAVQEHGEMIIAAVRGDLDNVIGLPVARLMAELSDLGAIF